MSIVVSTQYPPWPFYAIYGLLGQQLEEPSLVLLVRLHCDSSASKKLYRGKSTYWREGSRLYRVLCWTLVSCYWHCHWYARKPSSFARASSKAS